MKMKAGGCFISSSVLEFKGDFQYFTSSHSPPHMNFHILDVSSGTKDNFLEIDHLYMSQI